MLHQGTLSSAIINKVLCIAISDYRMENFIITG